MCDYCFDAGQKRFYFVLVGTSVVFRFPCARTSVGFFLWFDFCFPPTIDSVKYRTGVLIYQVVTGAGTGIYLCSWCLPYY